jgi:phospholipase D
MLNRVFTTWFLLSLLIAQSSFSANNFLLGATYDICFTPGNNCASKIIRAIAQAKQEVLVQAYSFSDPLIAEALVAAKTKGVMVNIILDKSQVNARSSLVPYFISNNINPVIDDTVAIAHNKTVVIDQRIVVMGSYNFTLAAKNKNAENVVIIDDPKFAATYVRYWYERKYKSKEVIAFRLENYK